MVGVPFAGVCNFACGIIVTIHVEVPDALSGDTDDRFALNVRMLTRERCA